MKNLKVLWIEDDPKFPGSIIFRIQRQLKSLNVEFQEEILVNGTHVSDTVRDWKPDLILMDHNLQDVTINGANLIIQIRVHDHTTPIIFYSSEMDQNLIEMVDGESDVFTSPRGDLADEILRLIQNKFPS